MKVSVLGQDYEIIKTNEFEQPRLEGNVGLLDPYTKQIFITAPKADEHTADVGSYYKKILRHEITHAFLTESGLIESSDWAVNEEAVDWFSIQFPKLLQAFESAGAI